MRRSIRMLEVTASEVTTAEVTPAEVTTSIATPIAATPIATPTIISSVEAATRTGVPAEIPFSGYATGAARICAGDPTALAPAQKTAAAEQVVVKPHAGHRSEEAAQERGEKSATRRRTPRWSRPHPAESPDEPHDQPEGQQSHQADANPAGYRAAIVPAGISQWRSRGAVGAAATHWRRGIPQILDHKIHC